MASKAKDNKAKVKMLQHWEKDFGCEFDYDQEDGFVVRLRCKLSTKWESRINNTRNFSLTWINPGLESMKDTNSASHLEAKQIENSSKMGIETYMNRVVDETPIGRSIKNMCTRDRESLKVKFNSAYYQAKRERPFSDFSDYLDFNLRIVL